MQMKKNPSNMALPALKETPTVRSESSLSLLIPPVKKSSGIPKSPAKKLSPLTSKPNPPASDAQEPITNAQGRVIKEKEAVEEAGDAENQFMSSVIAGDVQKVTNLMNRCPNIAKSDFAGGVSGTSMLYAIRTKNLDMIKVLYKSIGKVSLDVQDYKGRNAVEYARSAGLDLIGFLEEVKKDDKFKQWVPI